MPSVLLTSHDPRAFLRAIRDQLQKGSSPAAVIAVFAGILALVALSYLLTRLQRGRRQRAVVDNPKKLYRGLLERLDLTDRQQLFMRRLAGKLRLRHPAVVLISPAVFDHCVQQWQSTTGAAESSREIDQGMVSAIRRKLFPEAPSAGPDSYR
jgi:hypothetical protein